MDRTNWDFGNTTINILMISVTWNGTGTPLIWTLLPTAGNSNSAERTGLLDRLCATFNTKSRYPRPICDVATGL